MPHPSGASRELIHVLVADSNQTQSQLLSSALRRQPGMRVTCCHSKLTDCLEAVRSTTVDVVILSGDPSNHDHLIEMLRGLRSHHPNIRLILLSDSYDRNLVINAMRAGAHGLFCRASQPFRALCRCITVVQQGQFWVNTEQIGYVVEALSLNFSPRVVNSKGVGLLTAREEQIVNLVVEGITNREMAEQLDIRENTVKKSLQRIYDKLGVSNRVELVLYALTHRGTEKGNSVPKAHLPVIRSVNFTGSEISSTIGPERESSPKQALKSQFQIEEQDDDGGLLALGGKASDQDYYEPPS